MSADKILGIVIAVMSGFNIWFFGHNRRRKNNLDRREKALAEKEKMFSLLLPEEQQERLKDALVDIFAGAFQVPASILRGGLSKEQEAAFERNFNPPSDKANDVKHDQICLCTAKVDPGDGFLDSAIYCDLHEDALESIHGSNGAVRHQANEIACAFMDFISELWENGNHAKEASLYVVFTED